MTHLDLLNKLPSPIKEQAIENCKRHNGEDWLNLEIYNTLPDVLSHGVDWHSGRSFDKWRELYLMAKAGEFDDPSVTLPREDWEDILEAIEPMLPTIYEKLKQQIKP